MLSLEEKLLHPKPGSKIAAARDFGIDLTLLIGRLRLTPEERLLDLQEHIQFLEEIRGAARKPHDKSQGRSLIALARQGVDFVVVGDIAASLHGSRCSSFDLELCYSIEDANLPRLIKALAPFHPKRRDIPTDLPSEWDIGTLSSDSRLALGTEIGTLTLLDQLDGVGGYPEVRAASVPIELFGCRFAVLSLDGLIAAKRAAGRPKDMLLVKELEALRELNET